MIRCVEFSLKLVVGIVLSFSLLSEAFILNAADRAHAKMAGASKEGALHIVYQRPIAAE